jgi:hypothetical protein
MPLQLVHGIEIALQLFLRKHVVDLGVARPANSHHLLHRFPIELAFVPFIMMARPRNQVMTRQRFFSSANRASRFGRCHVSLLSCPPFFGASLTTSGSHRTEKSDPITAISAVFGDSVCTMKTLLSIICTVALSTPALYAEGPAAEAWNTTKETAKSVGHATKETAKDVGHTLKKGTKKAAHTVKEALTPDPDANRVDVKVAANRIDVPKSITPGKTAFVVTNTSNETLTFEVEKQGQEQEFTTTVDPGKTKVIHVHLETGKYHAGVLIKGRDTNRKEVNFRVK